MESCDFFISSETKIHASITRQKEQGREPLLVFLHYWGGTSSTWYKLTAPDSPTSIAGQYPTISLDLRGWGQSTGPASDNGTSYSISAMATDVLSVLAQIDSHEMNHSLLEHGIVFIGHSMGAKVAFATLNILPPDLLNKVRGLVLVAPAPPTPTELPSEMQAQQQAAYQSEESARWTVHNVLSNAANLSSVDIDMLVRGSFGGNEWAKKAWPLYGMQEDIHGLSCNLLALRSYPIVRIIIGADDIVEPKHKVESEVISFLEEKHFPFSTRVVANTKHLLPLEAPDVIADEIRQCLG
ncbi:alpha/beta hydrolase [Penicillium capsulatum]|uniref:Alpha/beta hydrolase n=1 Tax=Penicillium capsulatum TaxID=69766 RepID=A0A9W9LZL3_9EURO|nr:alpha/beta hydrolase [Penicillium capsulatum]KAJ6129315.1 alpha/beta hydrolase [Penicillium capsulatum]